MTHTLTSERSFTPARLAQGFTSQAHLDAFYAAYDHTRTCPACHALDSHALVDDGYQPTAGRCPTARALEAASFAF